MSPKSKSCRKSGFKQKEEREHVNFLKTKDKKNDKKVSSKKKRKAIEVPFLSSKESSEDNHSSSSNIRISDCNEQVLQRVPAHSNAHIYAITMQNSHAHCTLNAHSLFSIKQIFMRLLALHCV